MKKLIIPFVALFIGISSVMAQEPTFLKGDRVVNASIGLGSTLYWGTYYSTAVPPLSVSVEYGYIDNLLDVENLTLGLGGYVGFSMNRYRVSYLSTEYGWNYTNIILGARGAVHYPLADKLDTYTGLLVGPRIVLSSTYGDQSYNTSSARGSGIAYSYFFGARYYFSENLAVLGELGYGIAYLNIGLALKL